MTPYQREMRLMPHILGMEQRGVWIDVVKLQVDTNKYFQVMDELDDKICQQLGRTVDLDSNAALADAIEAAGFSRGFASTPTGKRSTAKESLIGAIAEPTLLGRLLVRGSISTCLRSFLQPWLSTANQNDGVIFVKWNQIRNYTDTGARTGRLSSSPNLQNIPVTWEALRAQLEKIGYDWVADIGCQLPHVRQYIIPAPGCIFLARDYSAQEMRLLAHFAGGGMLESLKADPHKDVHMIAADIAGITRKVAKTLGFAVLYGAGVGRIAESLSISVGEATQIKKKYLAALPEIKKFQDTLTTAGKLGGHVTTLGGRQYKVQAPAVVKGIFKTFEYKLTNYMIQGSAADQTKEAMYQYCMKTQTGQLVLSVHDQLVVQCPIEEVSSEIKILEKVVNGAFQEVLKYQVISDPSYGMNFGSMAEPESIANHIGVS
jgi:DNA polymerase-1